MRRTLRSASLWLCVTGALLTTGCASTLKFPWDDAAPRASLKNPVVQVMCVWERSEGHDPDGRPCRGFAGQILFLGNKGGTPVAVDGKVRVYVFDDLGTPEEQAKPLHQFDFDAASWNRHLHVGTLGPTYNVFIPYTRRGSYEANCALRVRFEPEEGDPIFSGLSTIALRGDKRKQESEAILPSTAPKTQRPARMTTIPLDGSPIQEDQAGSRADSKSASTAASLAGTRTTTVTPAGVPATDTSSDTEARLARMEQLLKDALAQPSMMRPNHSAATASGSSAVDAPIAASVPAVSVADATAATRPSTRFSAARLMNGPAATPAGIGSATHDHQTPSTSVAASAAATGVNAAPQRSRNFLDTHPLADEVHPATSSPLTSATPATAAARTLSTNERSASTAPVSTAAAASRPLRHPLADEHKAVPTNRSRGLLSSSSIQQVAFESLTAEPLSSQATPSALSETEAAPTFDNDPGEDLTDAPRWSRELPEAQPLGKAHLSGLEGHTSLVSPR